MSLKDKHIFESNKLAFWFAVIAQVFQLMATILYADQRVGFVNTAFMATCQVIVFVISIYGFARYRRRTRGRYILMGCLVCSYFVTMIGSVHITYMWAFGPVILMNSLLFTDTTVTIIASVATIIINILYVPLFYKYSVEVADRHWAVLTDVEVTDGQLTFTFDSATTSRMGAIIIREKEVVVPKEDQVITGTTSYNVSLARNNYVLDAVTSGDGALSYASSNEEVVTVAEFLATYLQ